MKIRLRDDPLPQDYVDEIQRLEAQLAAMTLTIEQLDKCYKMRGAALRRPCINCGYVPKIVEVE